MTDVTGIITPPVTPPHYGAVAKTFHWAIFALVLVQIIVGLTMPEVHGRPTPPPQTLNDIHMSVGMLILVLIVLRFLWRLAHPVPQLAELPGWQKLAAESVHLALYALLIVDPVLGWIGANAHDWQVVVFGIPLPNLVTGESQIGHTLSDVHILLSYVLMGVIGLHVLAALYHYFVKHDRVLQRMLPGG
jgi:cytochrome b561